MIKPEEFLFFKKKLAQNENLPLKIVSDSMEPLLKIGQEIHLTASPINELRPFDLIVFLENHKLVCHFYWHQNRHDGTLLTRSLKRPRSSDFPIQPDHYLGRVVGIHLSFAQKTKVILLNLLSGSL